MHEAQEIHSCSSLFSHGMRLDNWIFPTSNMTTQWYQRELDEAAFSKPLSTPVDAHKCARLLIKCHDGIWH